MRAAAVLAVLLIPASPVVAQFSALSRTEVQSGNTPFTEPGSLTTLFEQLNLRFDAGSVRVSGRLESFLTHREERRYTRLAQARVTARLGGFDATVGHFYDILGRGLLLRGFEIPGATYEDAAFRVRQSFQRDIEGATIAYRNGPIALRVLRGKPLLAVLPPTRPREERRPDLVTAGSGSVRFGPLEVGGNLLRNEAAIGQQDFGSVSGRLRAGGASGYVEYATQRGGETLSPDKARALYAALTYGRAGGGGSLEYKDYQNFFLGSGFNDPPSLVREHSWVVLNRSTHVLNAVNETGFQVELYTVLPKGTLTLNTTRAVNEFGESLVYKEYYAEFASVPLGEWSGRAFVDAAEDPLKGESARRAAGFYLDRKLAGPWSVSTTLEGQRFTRDFLEDGDATNFVVGVTASRSTRYSAGLVWERSTDAFLTDDPRTAEIETSARQWLGVNLGWRPNRQHTLGLFVGTRRGGPACTSGICYEVLDFEGAELRVTSRF